MTTSSQSLHYMIFSLSVCIICIIHNYVNNLHLCVVSLKRARKKKMTEGGKRKTTSKQNRLFLLFFPLSLLYVALSLKIELKFHYKHNFKSPDDVVFFFLSFSIFYTIVAYLEQGPNKQLNLNYISYSLCAYVILLCFCSSIFVCCVHK